MKRSNFMMERIAKMSRRRQKIALRRMLESDLAKFQELPNTPWAKAQVGRVIVGRRGAVATLLVQPIRPVEHIKFEVVVAERTDRLV